MKFTPHTPDEVRRMLNCIGAPSVASLFEHIPASLRAAGFRVEATASSARFVVGTAVPTALETLALVEGVRRIEPARWR